MPVISVILPVYNAERFLKEAIDSILQQTFADFELLLINDGSTDSSEAIIRSYSDTRIVYIKNDKNEGLIYSLNKAIDLARGQYIARMDADDVSLPERFEKQVKFMEQHADVGVVATTIKLINEDGSAAGHWPLDKKCISPSAIRRWMTKECCIAHPTILAKADLLKLYRYNPTQAHIEDFDLWLRMLDNGVSIGKLENDLLLYRIHSSSVTQSSHRRLTPQKRIFLCKKKYLLAAFSGRRFTLFNLSVLMTMPVDFVTSLKKTIFKAKSHKKTSAT